MFDIIVKNGFVLDGSGNPWFKADVAVEDGKISQIGRISTSKADGVIDARGLVVSPGFIDMHSHSDFFLLVNPRSESKIRQGITTEVIGNCGFSMAPIYRRTVDFVKKELGALANEITWDWSKFEEYRAKLLRQGISVNVAALIGHGILRGNVVGYENREPTRDELDEMKALLAESMGAGAFGMSTGLIYTPGSYAKTKELIQLAKVVSEYGGIYTSHIRNESDRLLEAVREAIGIGEAAGVPVEISHMKSAGRNNWGRIEEALKVVEAARDRGVEVTCDFYPYTAGSTGLDACLPPWVHEGGKEEMFKRLQDEVTRKRIKDDMEKGVEGWENLAKNAGWDNVVIAYCEKNKQYEGLSISEIAKKQEADPFNAAFNLLLEEEGVVDIVLHEMWEEDMKTVMKHPLSMVGTDGEGYAPYGPLARGKPHPRNYGTFPRIIGRYVREEKILMLQDAIRKMTSLPAEKLGLYDRGLVREGFWADMVIFDPLKVTDKATFASPHQYPDGIEYVIVNGEEVIRKGKHTERFPGKVLQAKRV